MLFGAQIDPRVLQYVLEKNPSLALFQKKRFSGSHTLLQTICAQWVVQVRNRKLRANDNNKQKKQNNQTVVSRSGLLLDDELLNRWRKLVLMVRAAHRVTSSIDTTIDRSSNSSSSNSSNATTKTIQGNDEIPELHLALQLGGLLPRAVIAQFIEVYPEQAAKPILGKRTTPLDGSIVLSCPRKLQHRSLPLHLAISTQRLSWNDGLKALVYAHPTALFREDCKNLVPFLQQATAAQHDDEKESWNTVYCLLREDPSVLSRILVAR